MNVLPAVGELDPAGPLLQVRDAGRLALPIDCATPLASVHAVGVRPEHWMLTPGEGTDGLHASVDAVERLDDATLVHCRLRGRDACTITVKTLWPGSDALPRGTRVRLEVRPRDLMLFDAQGRALAA